MTISNNQIKQLQFLASERQKVVNESFDELSEFPTKANFVKYRVSLARWVATKSVLEILEIPLNGNE